MESDRREHAAGIPRLDTVTLWIGTPRDPRTKVNLSFKFPVVDPSYLGTLTPTPSTSAATTSGSGQHFIGEEDVRFSSPEGEVPAFDVHMKMPLVLRLTEPATTMGKLVLSRSKDTELAWARGRIGVDLYINAVTHTEKMMTSTTCRFDSTKGRAILPKEAIADFDSESFIRMYTVNHLRMQIGVFDTEISVLTSVHEPSTDSRAVSLAFD